MYCPYCRNDQSSVIDKRAVKGSGEIRRRRECLKCGQRYTTYERVGALEVFVVKRDGRKQVFDREKIRAGLERALEKRPQFSEVASIVNKIESKIRSKHLKEIDSKQVGQLVLSELKRIDKVAYLRFVSVYRQFKEPGDFSKELESLKL
jgi:transcriptional repressor NrdR